ncbi:hypothetical protein RhiirA5_436048 [Rhizophagus irregularis]|uniref:Uncharacterized protein n=1 Tax=Rhizophagus irregularis TaxID=588596 RepID=A0A2N0NMH8_9GLOM|nr:hypothetical protein RhiirA5_436048 [Rhizophagus irregularis]
MALFNYLTNLYNAGILPSARHIFIRKQDELEIPDNTDELYKLDNIIIPYFFFLLKLFKHYDL